jgi:hypothetical protein
MRRVLTTIGVFAVCVGATACGSSTHHHADADKRITTKAATPPPDPLLERLGLPSLHTSSPLPGYLMIADRDNNRIIILNPEKRIVWRFPQPGDLRPGQRFAGPDDAFFSADLRSIITNEEFSDTIAVVSLSRRPRITWEYGHQDVQGSSPGYLAHPDDAYLLASQQVQVADIINCRVL